MKYKKLREGKVVKNHANLFYRDIPCVKCGEYIFYKSANMKWGYCWPCSRNSFRSDRVDTSAVEKRRAIEDHQNKEDDYFDI